MSSLYDTEKAWGGSKTRPTGTNPHCHEGINQITIPLQLGGKSLRKEFIFPLWGCKVVQYNMYISYQGVPQSRQKIWRRLTEGEQSPRSVADLSNRKLSQQLKKASHRSSHPQKTHLGRLVRLLTRCTKGDNLKDIIENLTLSKH